MRRQSRDMSVEQRAWSNSRVAHVEARADLVQARARPAERAAVVGQQVVELLQRHLAARSVVGSLRRAAELLLHGGGRGGGRVGQEGARLHSTRLGSTRLPAARGEARIQGWSGL